MVRQVSPLQLSMHCNTIQIPWLEICLGSNSIYLGFALLGTVLTIVLHQLRSHKLLIASFTPSIEGLSLLALRNLGTGKTEPSANCIRPPGLYVALHEPIFSLLSLCVGLS